jgi:phospholipid/cholesterol/gamma-HCH transport system permease protein
MASPARLSVLRDGPVLVVGFAGGWGLRERLPQMSDATRALDASPRPDRLRFEDQGLESWDTSLLVAVRRLEAAGTERGVEIDVSALPAGARHLLDVARSTSPAPGARKRGEREMVDALSRLRKGSPVAERIGVAVLEGLEFIGSSATALGRVLTGRTRRLDLDLTPAIQEAGAHVLPVLALIALLGGGVLSLLATQQLDRLGAILVAPNLVAIVIVRELGALVTGFALAGRWASTNAADLATMGAADEVDALRAVGVDPFDLLVAPRLLALIVMGPALVLYATFFGLLGSVAVGVALMDLPAPEYLARTRAALGYDHALTGLVKGAVFGVVVGLAACYHGLRSGRGPGAVGSTVKRAVVTAILWVVVADAALSAFFKWTQY